MIWTIIAIVFFTIAGIGLILVSLILFPPIYIGAAFVYSSGRKSVFVKSWWLHPWVVKIDGDALARTMSVKLFGKTLIYQSFGKEESKEPSDFRTEKKQSTTKSEKKKEVKKPKSNTKPDTIKKSVKVEPDEPVNKYESVPQPSDEPVDFFEQSKPEKSDTTSQEFTTTVQDKTAETFSTEKPDNKTEIPAPDIKKDSFFQKLKKNRYVYIATNKRWRKLVFKWVVKLIKRFFTIITFDRFRISIKAGIEDPSLLGKLFGVYEMIRNCLNVGRGYHKFTFEPVFMKYHFEGNGSFGIRTSVIQLIFPMLAAIFTFPYFTTLYLFWKSRKLSADKKSN